MSMVTTCPNCSTSFNVAPEVLLSRNGRVRCGQCKEIFDGLLYLITQEEFQATAGVAASSAPEGTVLPPAALSEMVWPTTPDVPDVPVPPMPLEIAAAASPAYLPDDSTVNEPLTSTEPAFVALPIAATPYIAGTHSAGPLHEEFEVEPETRPLHRGWAVAAVFATVLLAGQVIYRYRSELAANFPAVKPALAQLCAWAGCRVLPLQQPAALNIEASDLQVVDKAQPHLVQLTATLRNRATIDVGYPAFDLVLTDNREHALARRVIVPADYLPGANAASAAHAVIAANAEVTVRVDMDIRSLPAAGFRLNLTPAPIN
jgi:predicted Zn finger-like uncharacterized protein